MTDRVIAEDLKRTCSGCLGTGRSGHFDGDGAKHEYDCPYCKGRGFYYVESQLIARIAELEAMVFAHDKRHKETVADLQRQIELQRQAIADRDKVLEMARETIEHADADGYEWPQRLTYVLAAIAALQKPEVPK